MSDTGKEKDLWAARWNERYRQNEFAYGEEPNIFLKEQLTGLPIGAILFPAEGEGRNAVYAAKMGWTVSAFDISKEGQKKAFKLAEKSKVTIDYRVGELEGLLFENESFDAIALIYAHFPAKVKSHYHKTLDRFLKTNGTLILEAFSKKHLDFVTANEKVGGPKDIDSLISLDEIRADFSNFEIIELEEKETELHEGLFHNGIGSVIRFVGRKTSNR